MSKFTLITLLILGGIIIASAAGFGGFFFGSKKTAVRNQTTNQKQEITKDWKVYPNSKFGYSIKYPQDWYLVDEENSEKVIFSTTQNGQKPTDSIKDWAKVQIQIFENHEKISLKDWLSKNQESENFDEKNSQEISIAGQKGFRVSPIGDAMEGYFLAKDEIIYSLKGYWNPDDPKQFPMIWQAMVDSFQFGTALGEEMLEYTVQPGDTLFDISMKFNVKLEAIAKANNLQDPYPIYIGQVLKIPGVKGASTESENPNEKKFEIDKTSLNQIQSQVDTGRETWRLDPVAVAKSQVPGTFEIQKTDRFTLKSKDTTSGQAVIEVKSGDKIFEVTMIQPVKIGSSGIWTTYSVTKK